MGLQIKQLAIGGYDNNFSYFIVDVLSKEIAIVDPDNVSLLVEEIERENYKPAFILVTHTHFDHIRGVDEVAVKYDIPVYVGGEARDDLYFQKEIKRLEGGEIVKLGANEIKILATPGHAKDAICFYMDSRFTKDDVPKLITGDTLFVGKCGRADLEGSNVEDFYKSLRSICELAEETEIFPGHDYGEKMVSTLGWEKKNNPYLQCGNLEEFINLRLRKQPPSG